MIKSFSFITLITLAGCADFGPNVVRNERTSYNEAVHDTSAEQLLLNIVRAENFEAPSFSDFVEFDSTPSATLQIGAGSTSIGATPTTGILNPSFSASESALQKNVSVTGGQLSQQVASPITLQSIRRLAYASEPNIPLYRFSFLGLGPFLDYNRTIHLLDFLDTFGALDVDVRTPNTMTIGLRAGFLNEANANITQDDPVSCVNAMNKTRRPSALVLWDDLKSILKVSQGGKIILRTSDASVSIGSQNEVEIAEDPARGNLVYTGTALGALRQTAVDDHTFKFSSHADAVRLRAENGVGHEQEKCLGNQFYISEPTDHSKGSISDVYDELFRMPFQPAATARISARDVGSRTILLIIEENEEKPPATYVSIQWKGKWYSIDDNDLITKQNFALLNDILTIQAVSVNTTPTSTTLSVSH